MTCIETSALLLWAWRCYISQMDDVRMCRVASIIHPRCQNTLRVTVVTKGPAVFYGTGSLSVHSTAERMNSSFVSALPELTELQCGCFLLIVSCLNTLLRSSHLCWVDHISAVIYVVYLLPILKVTFRDMCRLFSLLSLRVFEEIRLSSHQQYILMA